MKVTIILNKEQVKKLKDDMKNSGSLNTVKKEVQEIIDDMIFHINDHVNLDDDREQNY